MNMDYTNGGTSTKGLVIFAGMQLVNLGALVTDYILVQTRNPTITELSLKYPVVAVLISGIQFIPPFALASHFWYSCYNEYQYFLEPNQEQP